MLEFCKREEKKNRSVGEEVELGGAIFGFSTTAPFSLTASAMTGTSAVGGKGGCYFDESTKRGKRRPWRRSWRRVFYVVIRQP
jgi:hypothetical protein